MKIFIIFAFAIFSIIFANPLEQTVANTKKKDSYNYQLPIELADQVEFKQFAFKNGQIIAEEQLKIDDVDDDDEDYVTYRLPNNTRPVRYDLWVQTDVEKENFNFTGLVKIEIRAIEDTDYVTLNYRHTVIDNIDLFDATTSALIESNLTFVYLEPLDREFLKITLPSAVNQNDTFILEIAYHGELHVADDNGFYKAYYIDKNTGDTVWYATTKFEPHHARHLMPCFDEPSIRAPISLQVQHDKSYQTYANMPLLNRTPVIETDYVISSFEDTPPMQTYLLAFLVSAFEYVSNNATDVEQRIFAKPQSIHDGEADYAASISNEILKKFEEILKVPFMLPKLDHAAITQFPSGAMENFGFISYREAALLLNSNYSETQVEFYEKYILRLLAHEITHMWFGDTVSPQWWTYLWLNEGFATVYEYYVPHLLYPDSGFYEEFRTSCLQYSLRNDIITVSSAVPMDYYVEEQTAIRGRFNFISYQKSGTVLMMFQEALGTEVFLKGLTNYLNVNFFKAATPNELFVGIQDAYDEAYGIENTINIASVMSTWTTQAGYPIISIEKSGGGKIKLSQMRYPSGNGEIYSVPLTFATGSNGADFENKKVGYWLTAESVEIDYEIVNYANDDDWIIFNNQQVGFYRVDYSDELWLSIGKGLKANHNAIHLINRRILQEELNIGISILETVQGSTVLEILSFFASEDNYLVWNDANVNFQLLNRTLFGTSVYNYYTRFIQSITSPLIDQIGYEGIESESSAITSLRLRVKPLNCYSFDESCMQHEHEKLIKYYENDESVSPDFCSAFRLANQTIFGYYLEELVTNENLKNRNIIARSIHCSLNEDYLGVLILAIEDATNILTSTERINLINYMLVSSSFSFNVAFAYIKRNVDKFNSFKSTIISVINTQEHYGELRALLNEAIDEEVITEDDANEVTNAIEQNMIWQDKHFDDIKEWFENNYYVEDTTTTTLSTTTVSATTTTLSTTTTTLSTTTVSATTTTEQPTTLSASGIMISFYLLITSVIFSYLR